VTLPLIGEPGIPAPDPVTGRGLLLQNPGTCQFGATTPAVGVSSGRLNPLAQATNVAVPDQTIGDALSLKWNINPNDVDATADTAEDFILGFPYVFAPPPLNAPHSQIEVASALQPTFVSFWLGSNDALGAALAATVNSTTLTPLDDFIASAHAAADAIAGSGAKGVLLNVPDVTVIPNLFSEPELESLTGLSAGQIGRRLGVDQNSFVPMSALPAVEAILNGTAQGPLAANQILTGDEVNKIRKRIKQYNKTLKMIASEKGWAYVDLNAILTDYDRNGVTIAGVGTLTTGYLGGLFGLDGIHPSATGHALIASAVIESINKKYTTTLAPPDVAAIAAADPQVCMTGT
jgi:GDSL-like Lipase/Acylhydrolase